ncbi:MAG: hypothetical protein Q8N63_02390 [Nanoarchaeota archaeon]|nr:hypothetical protein [Nanoarchaeota archaeon]
MKIELYAINDIHAQAFRLFLNKNNLLFKEIRLDSNYTKTNVSYLKITKNHSITIINGFNEFMLNDLIEHIKKYNPKIEV